MFVAKSSSEALIVAIERADVEDSVTALGNLQPRDYVDVGAQVSGQLDTLHVDVGATVKKGDLLAEIDPQLQSAKVQADRAQLKNLRAQQADRQARLDLARGQHSRQKMLKAANATSEDAYQSALSSMRSADFTILGAPRKRWDGKLRQILPTPENVNNVVLYTALFDVSRSVRKVRCGRRRPRR